MWIWLWGGRQQGTWHLRRSKSLIGETATAICLVLVLLLVIDGAEMLTDLESGTCFYSPLEKTYFLFACKAVRNG
jgi:hypothetical protein